MKKILVASFVSLLSLTSFASEGDLVLPGAKWIAKHKNYVCESFDNVVYQPTMHSSRHVIFHSIVTDSTLDNGLIKASFMENGRLCKYSAIMLADNAAKTIRLVESKVYSYEGAQYSCAEGKEMLDAQLEANDYIYGGGKPHQLAVLIPLEGACRGANRVGVNFVVSGRIQ